MSLSVLDNEDRLIKTYEGDALATAVGLNRMSWDMNYPDAIGVPGKPPASVVVQAKPGTYKARLTVNGDSASDRAVSARVAHCRIATAWSTPPQADATRGETTRGASMGHREPPLRLGDSLYLSIR